MHATLLKALMAFVPVCLLFAWSLVSFVHGKAVCTFLQLLGAGCLVVVVLTHISEALALLDIIGDSVYLFHANLFDLTRQTARVLGCDQPDARRVRPCAASLCCGLCCPLSARQDLGRQGTPTPERRWGPKGLGADGRQNVLFLRRPRKQ